MNQITEIFRYSEKTARVSIENRNVATKAEPGQFIIVKFEPDGHRIPFSIIATRPDDGSFDIIIHRAAGLDSILEKIQLGSELPNLLGPLGNPADIKPRQTILFFGDGSGVVPLLPLMKLAKSKGCHIKAVLSEQSSRTQCLLPEIDHLTESVVTVSDDNMLEAAFAFMTRTPIDKVIMAGPSLIMKRLAAEAKKRDIAADCVLNMLMIDGIGLCGICRVIVGGERKQTCTDGPIFDAHLVDFDQMYNRQSLFV